MDTDPERLPSSHDPSSFRPEVSPLAPSGLTLREARAPFRLVSTAARISETTASFRLGHDSRGSSYDSPSIVTHDASERLLPPNTSTTSTRASWVSDHFRRTRALRGTENRAFHDARIASADRRVSAPGRFLPRATAESRASDTPVASSDFRSCRLRATHSRFGGRRDRFPRPSVKRSSFDDPRCLPSMGSLRGPSPVS
jgi:hypothetical protein